MTLHLQECLDLADCQVLPVAQRDQLVEGAEQFIGIFEDLSLLQALASVGDHLGEEVQGIDVLEDVGLAVGDEHHIELIQGLVDEADIILLNRRVLGPAVRKLRERGQERFYPGSWHLSELPREDSFPPPGADGCSQDNLKKRIS